MSYPGSFVLDGDFFVPVAVNGDQGFFAQHDPTADRVRELATSQEGLKTFKITFSKFFENQDLNHKL